MFLFLQLKDPHGLPMVSEVVDMRAALAARMGLPLASAPTVGHHHLFQQQAPHPLSHVPHPHQILQASGLPYYPLGHAPPMDTAGSAAEYAAAAAAAAGESPDSPGFIHKQMQLLEQAHPHVLINAGIYTGAPITDAQVILRETGNAAQQADVATK